ncbi:putative membrane protein [Proteus phage vB_PmiP_Pm5460]|uniref:Putative membrane protein n=1 Tax=Proteus phage vB_PmiP_Pm5460 TaxID=1636249 RepID=A0A0G2SSG0_9CAUD|nr:hypothetical protein AVT60_gp03 [Proteus phage vB_PmiP_Pm5460]AKA61812.1 putative membrane protein [Proteus phage vB_PmiP_Pm5460]
MDIILGSFELYINIESIYAITIGSVVYSICKALTATLK